MENKKKKEVIVFNPSSREQISVEKEELDYIEKVIREAALQFAEEREKRLMIFIIALIRKKLREDKTFSSKLRKLLELDKGYSIGS